MARTIEPGEKIILIEKETFDRTEFFVGSDTITVYSLGVPFFIEPGVTEVLEGNTDAATGGVFANATDGIDNDLDGLIDENSQVHYRQFKKTPQGIVLIDTLNPVQYKDYINNVGLSPILKVLAI